MKNLNFGGQLRNFRLQCRHIETGKSITQIQFAEYLYTEIEILYTGTAISDWELNKSKIDVNNRFLLTSLIKVLKKYGGIKTIDEANALLEIGNYRALNLNEIDQLFPEISRAEKHENATPSEKEKTSFIKSLTEKILFDSPKDFQKILNQAQISSQPAWVYIIVSLIIKKTTQWSIFHTLKFIAWVWIWTLSYFLILPSLHWQFNSSEDVKLAMVLYISGVFTIPALIGVMANTKNKKFWQELKIANTITTRLYVQQGAFIGFYIGYFFIFILALIQNQINTQPSVWAELIKISIPIILSYASAHLVPYNLWSAYGKLDLRDGWVFFIFPILGPLWAWFFFEFYEIFTYRIVGLITILSSITLCTFLMAIQYKRKGNTNIPILWWVIFWGLILICQITSLLIQ